jgi:hypothetical protein
MTIRDQMRKKGLELMSDPRVLKLMQNEQFMRAMSTVFSVPGKVNAFTTEQTERFARTMNLATAQQMKDLQRKVRNLEEEIERLKKR